MLKKIITLTLTMCLVVTLALGATVTVSAAAAFGSCGPSMSWRIEKGVLSITGTGEMLNFGKVNNAPWYSSRSAISSIVIESGITTIGDYAFFGCGNKLSSVTIPETVLSIGNFAFTSCKSLEKITLPGSLVSIGNSAFKDCTSLKAIAIPTAVRYLGSEALAGCVDLESVVISRLIPSIEPRTFENCSLLSSVIIPDGVSKICENAFAKCGYLKTVSIGKDVTTVEAGAFAECNKITDVKYNGSSANWALIDIQANNETFKKAHIIFNADTAIDDETIMIFLNGEKLSFDQPPVIIDGRTLVPLRAIFEALGADVFWEDATKTVTAKKGHTVVSLVIGSKAITVNTTAKELDVPAQIINSRTLVPVRAISEAFGCDVGWDAVTQSVLITE